MKIRQVGIPKKIQKNLFKKVVTTKGSNGTGLGLYSAFSIITNNFEGKINYEVDEGVGTKFILEIPTKL